MKLTLKLHQLLQAARLVNVDNIVDALDTELTFKELQDGLYAWRSDDPSNSQKLPASTPVELLLELMYTPSEHVKPRLDETSDYEAMLYNALEKPEPAQAVFEFMHEPLDGQ